MKSVVFLFLFPPSLARPPFVNGVRGVENGKHGKGWRMGNMGNRDREITDFTDHTDQRGAPVITRGWAQERAITLGENKQMSAQAPSWDAGADCGILHGNCLWQVVMATA